MSLDSITARDKKTCKKAALLLLQWYKQKGRRFPWRAQRCSTYRRIASEVLLQRTTASAVARMYGSFFDRFGTWSELSKANRRTLRANLKPIGLWRRRAESLSALATAAVALREKWPRDREVLEEIPAVGQYVASSILLFYHGQSEPLLDTNMARVLERVFRPRRKVDIRHDKWLWLIACELLKNGPAIELNWAILDVGALYCRPKKPLCPDCPVVRVCNFAKGRVELKR